MSADLDPVADADLSDEGDLGRDAGWHATLDRLAAAVIDTDGTPWAEPSGLGALPPYLVDRATSVLSALREAIAHVEHERDVTARHLSLVRAVEVGAPPHASVYIDVSG